jgi:hypothetical protein
MKQLRNNVIRAGLEALYLTGAHHLPGPIFAGVGTIFTLHHVRPPRDGEFQPNRHLDVAPEFFRARCLRIFTRATSTSSRWTNCTRDFANAISRGALPVSPSTTAIATTGISRFRS